MTRRRARTWPWLVALAVVAVVAVVGWFSAEAIARTVVTTAVRDEAIRQLGLPADQHIDVTVDGTVIPQLIAGRFDRLTLSSDDVPLDAALSGDVTIVATGVVFRGDAAADTATARVVLDTAQLRALMATVEGFPTDTLGLREPDVTIATELRLLGAAVPVGIALTPRAQDGDIVLSPAALQLGDAEIDADELQSRFGGVADAVLREWPVCIAQYLPAALTLTDVAVVSGTVVGDFVIDPAVIADPALQAPGRCP